MKDIIPFIVVMLILALAVGAKYTSIDYNKNDITTNTGKEWLLPRSADVDISRCYSTNDPTGCAIMMVKTVAEFYGYNEDYDAIQDSMECDQRDCIFSLTDRQYDPFSNVVANYKPKQRFSICYSGGCNCEDIFKYFVEREYNVYCTDGLYPIQTKIAISNNIPVIVGATRSDGLGHAYLLTGYDDNVAKFISYNPLNTAIADIIPVTLGCEHNTFEYFDQRIYFESFIIKKGQASGNVCMETKDCITGLYCVNNMCQ